MSHPMFMQKFFGRSSLFLGFVGLLLPLALTTAGFAQQAPAAKSAPADHASDHAVVLPVSVRDKKGVLVENIQKSDLTLTEDGRPQTIASFTRVADQPYRVGMLVDTSREMNGALESERKAADKFVDQVLPAGGTKDQAFLIHFDREVELLEDFTASAAKLHSELDSLGPTHQERYEGQSQDKPGGDEPSSARKGHNGTQLYDAIFLASDELMKNQHGRKVLVVFSDGADRGSKDTLNDAVDAADRAGVTVYTIFMKGEQERESGLQNSGNQRRSGGGWPGSGGGGYPGGGNGGGGRKTPEPKAANGIDGKKVMQQLAARTGGHAYEAKKKDDLEAIYNLINQEMRGQYLLTYTPDKPDTDGGFHKVVVTAANKDMTVTAPEGYYAPEK